MEKISIQNRKKQEIAILLEKARNSKGLVFVMHGFSGNMRQSQIETFAQSFHEKGFTVVRFDATNTIGESFGKLEKATATNYYEDLEDVISWAGSQAWYVEPFVLAGHSLGGLCSLLYAQKYPAKVKAIAPISTVVSGEAFLAADFTVEELEDWKENGMREWESGSVPGLIKRLKWDFVEDVKKYDAIKNIDRITIPILLMVGDQDKTTPLEQQEFLYEKLEAPKELHVIRGAGHTFKEKEHLDEIEHIFLGWIDKI